MGDEGQSGALKKIAAADQAAVKETTASQQNIRAARDKAEEIALNHVESSQNRLEKLAGQSLPPPKRAEVIHDRKLVDQAITAYEKDKPFTTKEADQAIDPEIRSDLRMVAAAQTVKHRFEREEVRLTEQLAMLLKMAAVALQRGSAMESLTEPASSGKKGRSPASAPSSSISVAEPSTIALASTKLGDTSTEKKSGTEGKPEEAGKSDEAELTALEKSEAEKIAASGAKVGGLRASLKEKLRKKLADAAAAKIAALGGGSGTGGNGAGAAGSLEGRSSTDPFSGKLNPEGGPLDDSAQPSGLGMGAQVVGAVLQASPEKFSLAGAETDASVQQIVGDAQRGLASVNSSDRDPSIQGINSVSLFERVRVVHKNCLVRGCVRGGGRRAVADS